MQWFFIYSYFKYVVLPKCIKFDSQVFPSKSTVIHLGCSRSFYVMSLNFFDATYFFSTINFYLSQSYIFFPYCSFDSFMAIPSILVIRKLTTARVIKFSSFVLASAVFLPPCDSNAFMSEEDLSGHQEPQLSPAVLAFLFKNNFVALKCYPVFFLILDLSFGY